MEKLCQALNTLSEAEKQLRMSNDRLTWLTAALLQLAPDQQYLLPTSSADTSFSHSPSGLNNANGRQWPAKSNLRVENHQAGSSSDAYYNAKRKGDNHSDQKGGKIEEIWLEVLDKIQINSVKEFMRREGKLISVSFGAGTFLNFIVYNYVNIYIRSYYTCGKYDKHCCLTRTANFHVSD